MEEKGRGTIEIFDNLMTTNRIQMMKVILSWLPGRQQGGLAVYIKFAEFQYAMQYLTRHQSTPLFSGHKSLPFDKLLDGSLLQEGSVDVVEFLQELLPFSGPSERTRIESIINLLNSISKMKEMMEMMEMMKELFPEGMNMDMGMGDANAGGSDGNTSDTGNPLDFLSGLAGMSGMDPSALFHMFGADNK